MVQVHFLIQKNHNRTEYDNIYFQEFMQSLFHNIYNLCLKDTNTKEFGCNTAIC